jgi:hypothetical protein
MRQRLALATFVLPLVLFGSACAARPLRPQSYAFGVGPWVGLRLPAGPTGIDLDLAPPGVYLNLFGIVSANVSLTLVELYVFPVSAGWILGPSPQIEEEDEDEEEEEDDDEGDEDDDD